MSNTLSVVGHDEYTEAVETNGLVPEGVNQNRRIQE